MNNAKLIRSFQIKPVKIGNVERLKIDPQQNFDEYVFNTVRKLGRSRNSVTIEKIRRAGFPFFNDTTICESLTDLVRQGRLKKIKLRWSKKYRYKIGG